MGGKDGSNIDVSLATQRNSQTSLPFMEVSNDSFLTFVSSELRKEESVWGRGRGQSGGSEFAINRMEYGFSS